MIFIECLQENPHAQAYRKKTLPNYSDLALIYENTYACESQGQLGQSMGHKNEQPNVEAGGSQLFIIFLPFLLTSQYSHVDCLNFFF